MRIVYGKGVEKAKQFSTTPWINKGYTMYQYMECVFHDMVVHWYKMRGGKDTPSYLTFRYLGIQDLRSMNES